MLRCVEGRSFFVHINIKQNMMEAICVSIHASLYTYAKYGILHKKNTGWKRQDVHKINICIKKSAQLRQIIFCA